MPNQSKMDLYYMRMAFSAASLSTCPRASVGAIVELGGQIASGYNGSPRRITHCSEVGCNLDQNGSCQRAVHAEINAILKFQGSTEGATLYCTHRPCLRCTSAIINAGIVRIVYCIEYNSGPLADEFIVQSGILMEKVDVDDLQVPSLWPNIQHNQ